VSLYEEDLHAWAVQQAAVLKDENNRSCCGIGDCRAVVAKEEGGHWSARLGDAFVPVPDSIVQRRDDNPTGHSILCASPVQPETLMYCFIPEAGV
jgi:hypothetical protein